MINGLGCVCGNDWSVDPETSVHRVNQIGEESGIVSHPDLGSVSEDDSSDCKSRRK